jgi:hypothetical protein
VCESQDAEEEPPEMCRQQKCKGLCARVVQVLEPDGRSVGTGDG